MTRALPWILVGVLACLLVWMATRDPPAPDADEVARAALSDSLAAQIDSLARLIQEDSIVADSLRAGWEADKARARALAAETAALVETEAELATLAGESLAATLDSIRVAAPEVAELVDTAEAQANARDSARQGAIVALQVRGDAEAARADAAERLIGAMEARSATVDQRVAALEETVRVQAERIAYWQGQAPSWWQRNWGKLTTGAGILGMIVGLAL